MIETIRVAVVRTTPWYGRVLIVGVLRRSLHVSIKVFQREAALNSRVFAGLLQTL